MPSSVANNWGSNIGGSIGYNGWVIVMVGTIVQTRETVMGVT